MASSGNLGRIRLTLDGIHNDMSKEIHQIPPIHDEGKSKLNLWIIWKMASLCSAGVHLVIVLNFLWQEVSSKNMGMLYGIVGLSILFWIYAILFNHPYLSYHMFGIYGVAACYYLCLVAGDFINFLFSYFTRGSFEDGIDNLIRVGLIILIAVISFPYVVMRIYQWWTKKDTLSLDDEFPRTIEEIPAKTIYYI